ncbi:MAG: Uma2 family endonuclease [Cyanobacteria bacterium P01_F01_bin.150]
MVTSIKDVQSIQGQDIGDQLLILPGIHHWQAYVSMQVWASDIPGLRISYLDGIVELMTTSKLHERIKKFIAILLELYFFEARIRFFPSGNATCEAEAKGASFAPDESYCFDEDKDYPDLAVEVVLTSGDVDKLEKYKRFRVGEVWFWKQERITVYVLRIRDSDRSSPENDQQLFYEKVSQSEALSNLDLALLERCVGLADIFEARTVFLKGLQK